MRVTKAIREYVEDEIHKKYQAVINEVGKEYQAEKAEMEKQVDAILYEAEEKARAFLAEHGYIPKYGYRNDRMISRSCIEHPEKEKECSERRDQLRYAETAKTKQVLFDLEMGETAKAELREVLDAITVE